MVKVSHKQKGSVIVYKLPDNTLEQIKNVDDYSEDSEDFEDSNRFNA